MRWSIITFLVLLSCTAYFLFQLYAFPLIPGRWKLITADIVCIIVLLCGFISILRGRRTSRKIVISTVNVFLSLVLLAVSFFLPRTTADIRNTFDALPETVSTRVNVYALTTEYKAAHTDIFRNRGIYTSLNLADYSNRQFITQTSVDQDNQNDLVMQLCDLYGVDHVWQNSKESIWEALDALYHADGDALILNEAYISAIEDTELYADFRQDTVVLHTFTKEVPVEQPTEPENLSDTFSVFIAGSDSREEKLSSVTRTDVDIVATVDPDKKVIMLVSFPRDSFIPNPAMGGGYDKLTHMGIYGMDNSMLALENILAVPVRNYVLVNFRTYSKVVNTMGGITINNPYSFNIDSYSFPAGEISLDGDAALAFVRARYSLPNGDFGRNEHQIMVLKALIRKALSMESLVNYQNLLEALSGTFLTNMDVDGIFDLIAEQLGTPGTWEIISYHITGSTGSDVCASMPGMYLSVVYPYDYQLQFVSEQIMKMYRNEDVVQEAMP